MYLHGEDLDDWIFNRVCLDYPFDDLKAIHALLRLELRFAIAYENPDTLKMISPHEWAFYHLNADYCDLYERGVLFYASIASSDEDTPYTMIRIIDHIEFQDEIKCEWMLDESNDSGRGTDLFKKCQAAGKENGVKAHPFKEPFMKAYRDKRTSEETRVKTVDKIKPKYPEISETTLMNYAKEADHEDEFPRPRGRKSKKE